MLEKDPGADHAALTNIGWFVVVGALTDRRPARTLKGEVPHRVSDENREAYGYRRLHDAMNDAAPAASPRG